MTSSQEIPEESIYLMTRENLFPSDNESRTPADYPAFFPHILRNNATTEIHGKRESAIRNYVLYVLYFANDISWIINEKNSCL